jgi:hypothetical protein
LVLRSIPKELPDEPTTENIPLHPEYLQLYIEMVEVSVMTDTSLALGPEHLVKAAEMARIGKLYQRSIKLYGWIGRLYPTHAYRTSGIFMQGYVTYFDLKNYTDANELFKEYLKQDPYGQFEFQANYLLNNPGKIEEEMQKALGGE